LKRREKKAIFKNPFFIKNVRKHIDNYQNIPKWFYKKIRKFGILSEERIEALMQPGTYDATYKVVIFGDTEVQKTELITRFLTNLFKSDIKMTIGVDFSVKCIQIAEKKIKLQVWDFGGEERFRFLLPTYVRGANGALFVYDVNKYSSLAHIDDWLMVIRKELRPEDQFPIVVVGLVSGSDDREVLAEEAIKIAKSRGVNGFIECSPSTGKNVNETFEALTRLMLSNSGIIA
jgi:small GTP-binding protein